MRSGVSAGDVGGMGGYARGNDAFADIVDRRQAQMLGGRDIAEKVGAGHACDRAADGAGNMVVARRDVGNERSEHVERRVVAQRFLHLDVR